MLKPSAQTRALCELIANIRRERSLTQIQISTRSGLSQATISRIERCQLDLTMEQLAAITRVLDVRPALLLDTAHKLTPSLEAAETHAAEHRDSVDQAVQRLTYQTRRY